MRLPQQAGPRARSGPTPSSRRGHLSFNAGVGVAQAAADRRAAVSSPEVPEPAEVLISEVKGAVARRASVRSNGAKRAGQPLQR